MKRWKVAFFLCLIALLASNVFWIYAHIDSGVSYTYLSESLADEERKTDILSQIVILEGKNLGQKDILAILRRTSPEAFIVEGGNIISIDSIEFVFMDGKLTAVR